MTQRDMILQYMQDNGSITPKEAEENFGCMRLASRIDELRNRGYSISTTMESCANRHGKKVKYARYSLITP